MYITRELSISLDSTPGSVERIEPFIQRCQCNCQFNEMLYHDILLVLTEAVNNGIIHGNRLQPNKTVKVCFSSDKDTLRFIVSDEGSGFNPHSVPDPTRLQRLDKPNGRGVYLMKALADKLDYLDNGRKVSIEFKY